MKVHNTKVFITIGERSEKKMSYDEAVLYCFCLGEGWRLPTWDEYGFPAFHDSWWQNRKSEGLQYVQPIKIDD